VKAVVCEGPRQVSNDLEDAGTFGVDRQVQEASRCSGRAAPSTRTSCGSPDDLPAFCERIVREFAAASQAVRPRGVPSERMR
jgi:hypothetical protein